MEPLSSLPKIQVSFLGEDWGKVVVLRVEHSKMTRDGTFSRGAWAKIVHPERKVVSLFQSEGDCLKKRLSKQSTSRVWEDRGDTQ